MSSSKNYAKARTSRSAPLKGDLEALAAYTRQTIDVNQEGCFFLYPRAVVNKLVKTRRSLRRGSAVNKLACLCSG